MPDESPDPQQFDLADELLQTAARDMGLDLATCNNSLKPMQEWIAGADPEVCRPCLLGPTVSFYIGELQDRGEPQHIEQLRGAAQAPDVSPEGIALLLDEIKEKVPPAIRQRLRLIDCGAQSFVPDAP